VFKPPYLINKPLGLINKIVHDILVSDDSINLARIDGSRKSQTRGDAGTASHGSLAGRKEIRVACQRIGRVFYGIKIAEKGGLLGKVIWFTPGVSRLTEKVNI
jgi:hypothetical protein